MAFAAATAIIFGSAALTLGLAASKLNVHSIDDIQAKAKDLLHPKFETVKEGLHPLRDWERSVLKELCFHDDKIGESSMRLFASQSNYPDRLAAAVHIIKVTDQEGQEISED